MKNTEIIMLIKQCYIGSVAGSGADAHGGLHRNDKKVTIPYSKPQYSTPSWFKHSTSHLSQTSFVVFDHGCTKAFPDGLRQGPAGE